MRAIHIPKNLASSGVSFVCVCVCLCAHSPLYELRERESGQPNHTVAFYLSETHTQHSEQFYPPCLSHVSFCVYLLHWNATKSVDDNEYGKCKPQSSQKPEPKMWPLLMLNSLRDYKKTKHTTKWNKKKYGFVCA